MKAHRVPDERIAEEVAELDALMEHLRGEGTSVIATNRQRFVVFALGARTALEWVRDSRQANPQTPVTFLRMLALALEVPLTPRVRPFRSPVDDSLKGSS